MSGTERAGPRRAVRGFSLIEVLVAMAIFAVLASTLVFQTGVYSEQVFRLEDKTVALWVAQNAIDEVRLARGPLGDGAHDDEVEMAGRAWEVATVISPTSRPAFHRVDVSVMRAGEDDTVLSLVAFVADRP